jgi:hypothetical protein
VLDGGALEERVDDVVFVAGLGSPPGLVRLEPAEDGREVHGVVVGACDRGHLEHALHGCRVSAFVLPCALHGGARLARASPARQRPQVRPGPIAAPPPRLRRARSCHPIDPYAAESERAARPRSETTETAGPGVASGKGNRLDDRLARDVVEGLALNLLDRARLRAVRQSPSPRPTPPWARMNRLLTPRRTGSNATSRNTRMSSCATGSRRTAPPHSRPRSDEMTMSGPLPQWHRRPAARQPPAQPARVLQLRGAA